MYWMVDELTKTVKEMLTEGNLHNIFVFTVITSSSVLSVVGAVRHIYTFIYNFRKKQELNKVTLRTSSIDQDDSETDEATENLHLELMDRYNYTYLNCQLKNYPVHNPTQRQQKNKSSTKRNNSPKCLKCDGGLWERHCVQGLCQSCCESSGGCQVEGHIKQPESYSPWFEKSCFGDQIISICHMDLKEFPSRFGFHCMNACGLDASHNSITEIPEHVTLMRGLVNISLSYNQLSYIPDYFSALHNLSFVDLRNNKISKFPDCLLELHQLHRLYLDHNHLDHIPNDIDKMNSLQSLSLGYNNITEICDGVFNLLGLKALCFRGNKQLLTLPAAVKNLIGLQKLDLSYCDLHLIPSTISSCTVLKSFYISNNRLVHIPGEVSHCYRLEQLDISCNRLTYLPAALLFRQSQLSIQTFGNNFLRKTDPTLQWTSVEQVLFNCRRHVPSLWLLSRSAVEKWGLDTGQLPMPVQNELINQSTCYQCGKKQDLDSVKLVKFLNFDPRPHPQSVLSQEYPFLFTFCPSHVVENSLDICIDASTFT
ncbi:leucine-rich repeat serine/threonine-protein kinase 2-like isoform X2 [Biomphalaria glabrata]|uniref:Uncharacterized protein LOC106057087 isoform X1 n=1 Tax=Biomphalaria glabrata TaxID=6526 RepID=A0A9W2ZY00_BIOGL|nr:uncharacterized protein LOC106057087 isoform X1 [Biomphalaria glabrata]XP_055879819.1 uncharacterized protein LOC106057087 isoform X1 [Biomphalaria glabrata]XP_055879820.1 uncharacterized protein LOC106057087 isoform X1 [Biomphalaria glabrata]KAI8735246.1 leucine-rich repeat serine/threonine-protein kinase 2-like isoform X2 [Biomphalaria glabrata]KAI8784525.1 leucine-rich repeat serine/threonine-protein kinase 2 isoform X2 [Biomphalaria glabrata]